MPFVTYLIAPCSGGSGLNIDFDSASLPVVGGNYYLTFTGATSAGCYEVVDSAEPSTGVDVVNTMSTNYGDCSTCLAVPTPTPTKTLTPTPTKTPTNTPTNTVTTTPTKTPTNTPTKTPTNTPTNTVTPTKTATPTPTPTKTTTPTPTPSITPTNTPSLTPFGVLDVNVQYEYTNQMLGSFSGGTWDASLGNAPHPISVNQQKRVAVIDPVSYTHLTLPTKRIV